MTFGIPVDLAPKATANGGIEVDKFHRLLETRRKIEEERNQLLGGKIVSPSEVDILCGRGKPFQGKFSINKQSFLSSLLFLWISNAIFGAIFHVESLKKSSRRFLFVF